MKNITALMFLIFPSILFAGGSGVVFKPALTNEMNAGLESTYKDLSTLDVLLRSEALSREEAALVNHEIVSTRARLKTLLDKLENSGVPVEEAKAISE
jgi:hypothetical protein